MIIKSKTQTTTHQGTAERWDEREEGGGVGREDFLSNSRGDNSGIFAQLMRFNLSLCAGCYQRRMQIHFVVKRKGGRRSVFIGLHDFAIGIEANYAGAGVRLVYGLDNENEMLGC